MPILKKVRLSETMALKRGRKATGVMRVAFSGSSLGQVIVASSDRGITAVLIGDDRDALRQNLAQRFPDASLLDADNELNSVAAQVVGYIESPGGAFEVPLDLQGTDFQRTVWTALRDIPAGATASYSEIANRIGRPDSVRAVAGACGANLIAVIVPCHRVIGKDGAMTGYAWGIHRKVALLQREKEKRGRGS